MFVCNSRETSYNSFLALRLGGALGTKPLDYNRFVTRHTPTLSNDSPALLALLNIMITHLTPPKLAQPPITWLPGNCVQRFGVPARSVVLHILGYACCTTFSATPLSSAACFSNTSRKGPCGNSFQSLAANDCSTNLRQALSQ